MKHPLRVNGLAVATFVLLGLASFSQATSPAAAAVTEAETLAAAQHGAQWILSLQESDGELGSFGGDWSMIALASVGINAADVHTSPLEPSAQDYYLSLWEQEPSVLSAATDYERAILTGHAGGLEPSRLDAQTNLVADLAAQFDGHELGGKGATNADIFGVLALDAVGAPSDVIDTLAQSVREQQDTDGGWNFAAGAKTSEADTTGAAIAALCTAGVTPEDPVLVRAFAYLRTVQDTVTGGFLNASHVNTDSTAWIISGLNACKVNPQGSEFTTSAGKTPIDFLIAQQNEDGSFQRHAHDEEEDLYSTQDAVRALAGAAFAVSAPPRTESGQPAIRPAPTVAAGTPVPMTLVIDSDGHVTGGSSIRMCKVIAPLGATVAQLLTDASVASSPSYCLSDLVLQGGRIARVNGVAAELAKSTWEVHREGGAGEPEANGTLGLGALVQLQLVSSNEPSASPPPAPVAMDKSTTLVGAASEVTPTRLAAARARLQVRLGPLTLVRNGRMTVELTCTPDIGVNGCSGRVRVRVGLRARHGGPVRRRVVGEREVHLAAGASGVVRITLDSAVLRALRVRDDRAAWVLAVTRHHSSSGLTTSATITSTVLR